MRHQSLPLNHKRQSGFTIVEMVVSMILLTAVMGTLLPTLRWISAERRSATQRQFAQLQVNNLLERISQLSWSQLTAETLNELQSTQDSHGFLRDEKLEISLSMTESPVPAKRVHLELAWRNRVDDFVAPVRLTAYFFQPSPAKQDDSE